MIFSNKGHFIKLFLKVVVAILSLNAVFLLLLGIYRFYRTVVHFMHDVGTENEGYPAVELAEVLEVLLLSFVMLIFSIGLKALFKIDGRDEYLNSLPKWLRVESFSNLKEVLMEAIVVSAFIVFITQLIESKNDLGYEFIIIPVSILLLSLSIYLMRKH